jgi:hypothetical protein
MIKELLVQVELSEAGIKNFGRLNGFHNDNANL